MKKLTAVLALLLFLLTIPLGSLAAPANAAEANGLSQTGKRAFEDLTRCINTKHVLNVYYLIDSSGSLNDTDRNGARGDILAASVKSLGNFRSDVKVNYAAGFFGDGFETWKSFRSINSSNANGEASSLSAEVKVTKRHNTNNTDWQKGIDGAAKALQDQAASAPGCQSLIWLTDGGLWIGKNGSATIRDDAATAAAQKVLCDSTMEGLRTSNISVFGVLLRNDQALADLKNKKPREYSENIEYMAKMRPLVEGEGNGERSCGQIPIQPTSSAGALLIATDPVALALQFLILTNSTEGGIQSNLPPGNPTHFEIEPGIRQFRLLTTSAEWKLTGPNGTVYQNGSPQIAVENTSGVQQITVDKKVPLIGKWEFGFKDGASNRLLLFSGLDIQLDPGQLIAGSNGKISGRVVVQGAPGEKVDLSVYGVHPFGIQEILSNNQTSTIATEPISNDGAFSATYQPSPNQGRLELRVTLNLRTKGGVELAPVSVSQFLEVKLPADYPSPETPIRLSDMAGKSAATGKIVLHGPSNGSGQVCIANVPNYTITIIKDSLDRKSTYKWDVKGQPQSGCLRLTQNEQASLDISVSNSKPADSNVEAALPITYKSDLHPDKDITLSTPIQFNSKILRVGGPLITILLLLLGVGIPLLGTYILYWVTTKLAFGSGIQRASYKVKVDSLKGITLADGTPITPKFDDFKFISNQPDTRSYKEEIGTLRAHLSPIPLAEPWFEIIGVEGTRLVTMVNPPQSAKKRFASGQIAAIKGDMNSFWALSIQESDLLASARTSSVLGQLVIYKRNKVSNQNQYSDRFFEVSKTAGIWARITEMRSNPLSEQKVKKEKAPKVVKGEAPVVATKPVIPPPPGSMGGRVPPPPPVPGSSS